MKAPDLFPADSHFRHLPIENAEVYYMRYLPLAHSADPILSQLVAKTPWRSERIVMWGKAILQPRLIAWYGDSGKSYSYSGIRLEPLPWTEALLDIKLRVEAACATQFNSALLNYYRDNRDSVGFHSDNEAELGEQPVIATLSLGAERNLVLKQKTKRGGKLIRLMLESGSLLLMKGATQQNWHHAILKEAHFCEPRLSLTFRQIRL